MRKLEVKKYQLLIIAGETLHSMTVFADGVRIQSGYYEFVYEGETLSCFPIERTIIRTIENADNE
jgi:hypothetical protein